MKNDLQQLYRQHESDDNNIREQLVHYQKQRPFIIIPLIAMILVLTGLLGYLLIRSILQSFAVQNGNPIKYREEVQRQNEERLKEAQHIASLGNWELNLVTNLLIWSDEVYRIFEIDKEKFHPSYEAFLTLVHPEDRKRVQTSYENSLKS